MKSILFLITIVLYCGCTLVSNKEEKYTAYIPSSHLSKAYFASGCFWCAEAIFESVKGVDEAVSGYSGGEASGANYSAVSGGYTKHAETVAVYYDSSAVSYKTLLKVFFGSHDPTTLNAQGPDVGKQYRSAIFYQTDEERAQATVYINSLYKDGIFPNLSITTVLEPFLAFYNAETYHQNFEKNHPNDMYVKAVSTPRINAFRKKFPELLKTTNH
jgi:peptide-methionine (S)-S-oxide reductase